MFKMKQHGNVDTRWRAGIDLAAATELLFLASKDCAAPPDFQINATLDPDDGTIVIARVGPPDSDDPGRYNVEVQATFPDGQIITFPDDGYATLVITPDLGPA